MEDQASFASVIGYGLTTPFQRGPADFAAATDVAQVQSMVSQVLGCAASSATTHGELPWRPEFGSLTHHLRHRPNNATTAELARVHVADALAIWLPQVRLKRVDFRREDGPDGEPSVMAVRPVYDIIGLSRPGNQVLVPDVSHWVNLI